MREFLTVEEVAQRARTTTTTVYRWLHTGRLQGMKIGKEWRIPADALVIGGQSARLEQVPEPSVWDTQADGGHILAVCAQRADVYRVEADFLNAAAARGQQMLKGCWWQDPAELAERYADAGADFAGMRRDGLLRVVDFNDAYERSGPAGPIDIWKHAIAARGTAVLWACGAPAPLCFGEGGTAAMLTFEQGLDAVLAGAQTVGLCTYSYEDLEPGGFSLLAELIERHSAVAVFDGENRKLLSA
jgi:excisionase family DNA binding protein